MRTTIELNKDIIEKFVRVLEKGTYKCNFGASELFRFSITGKIYSLLKLFAVGTQIWKELSSTTEVPLYLF